MSSTPNHVPQLCTSSQFDWPAPVVAVGLGGEIAFGDDVGKEGGVIAGVAAGSLPRRVDEVGRRAVRVEKGLGVAGYRGAE